jgi:hypothetical protein
MVLTSRTLTAKSKGILVKLNGKLQLLRVKSKATLVR